MSLSFTSQISTSVLILPFASVGTVLIHLAAMCATAHRSLSSTHQGLAAWVSLPCAWSSREDPSEN